MKKLLSFNNMKLQKNLKRGVLTAGLHLAPHKSSGFQVCANASPACIDLCIGKKCGGFRFAKVKEAQIRRTVMFFEERDAFLRQLSLELSMLEYEAQLREMEAAARLNVVSDILWERHLDMEAFPRLKFYDYTKHSLKARAKRSKNYHLVFSISEKPGSWTEARRWLDAGLNATMVVGAIGCNLDTSARAVVEMLVARGSVLGYPCISGDDDDLRYYEGGGKLVLLYPKGAEARQDTSGFVKRFNLERVTV